MGSEAISRSLTKPVHDSKYWPISTTTFVRADRRKYLGYLLLNVIIIRDQLATFQDQNQCEAPKYFITTSTSVQVFYLSRGSNLLDYKVCTFTTDKTIHARILILDLSSQDTS